MVGVIKKISSLSLRLRTLLFFVFLTASIPAVLVPGFYLAHDHILLHQDPAATLVLYGLGIGSGLILITITIAWLFDINVTRPIQGLIRDIETILHSNRDHTIETDPGKYLDHLPETVKELAQAYRRQRSEVNTAIANATQQARDQKKTLEVILHDLFEGVIICNLNNQVMLYNDRARTQLHVSGDIGLGRSLFSVINSAPILHSLRRLRNRLAEQRHIDHPEGISASFVCATCDGRYSLDTHMTLILEEDNATPTSYILTFEDMTEELTALGKRDHLLREATQGLRRPVANLRAAGEMMSTNLDMAPAMRLRFIDIIESESRDLSDRIEAIEADYQALATTHWPMADIYSANLLSLVALRLADKKEVKAVMTGLPTWLHGDSHSLLLALDYIVQRIVAANGAESLDLKASNQDGRIHLDIIWTGEALASATLDNWMDEHLTESIGGMSLRDILEHHRCEMWSEQIDDNLARIRLPMLPPHRTMAQRTGLQLPARPEFYDFGLLEKKTLMSDEIGNTDLSELAYVVFDTETTGLKPSEGDEILSIAGVRVLNSRILTGESFARMVNPKRKIPKASIKFHGITDEMVRDKPPAQVILPQFYTFCEGTVLVAHNAAFDMKFLELKEEECAVNFDHPVLDTLLLSVYLHDHTNDHSLDDIAQRFGIEIEGRHTAIGDALVTAGIFLRMIPLLKSRGIHTLNDAIKACQSIVEVKAQQSEF